MDRWLWIIAGPNGAGKSTLQPSLAVGDARLLNPDVETSRIKASLPSLSMDDANLAAARFTEDAVAQCIKNGESVVVETVLSTDKYKKHVNDAKQAKFHIGFIYVALSSPELAVLRVEARIQDGGHHVAPDKIRDRMARSIDNVPWFVENSDVVMRALLKTPPP